MVNDHLEAPKRGGAGGGPGSYMNGGYMGGDSRYGGAGGIGSGQGQFAMGRTCALPLPPRAHPDGLLMAS